MNEKKYSVNDIMLMLGLDGLYLNCKIEDLLSDIMNQAKAWQLLSHLADENLPINIASNKLGVEIKKYRENNLPK